MKRTYLALFAGASFALVATVASAQDAGIMDKNNPAPSYTPSASGGAGSQTAPKIIDNNNPAPNYSPSATGQAPQTSAKIMDGNNPAPNYGGPATPTPTRHASAKSTKGQHASHHHKNHTPAT